ncbi:MAG: C25 family cysteine peptidase [Promethearchaeota archaeon]
MKNEGFLLIGNKERKAIAFVLIIIIAMVLSPAGLRIQIPQLFSQRYFDTAQPNITEVKLAETKDSLFRKLPNGSTWIPLIGGYPSDSPPQSYVTVAQPAQLQVKTIIPGVWDFPVFVGKPPLPFDELQIPFSGFLTEIGNPEVPVITRLIQVPYGTNIQITSINYEEHIQYNTVVRPHQGPHFDHPDFNPPSFQQNLTTYFPGSSLWFPTRVAYLSGGQHNNPIIIRGHRVVALNILPVQFNGLTNSCKIFSEIRIGLNFQNTPIAPVDTRLVSPAFETLLEHTVLNYQSISFPSVPMPLRKSEPAQAVEAADYLIITTDEFKNAVQELADWKQQKGYLTKITTVEEIFKPGSDTYQEKVDDLTDYIKFAYDNWNPAPSYVLFVGDSDHIPPHYGMWHEMHLAGIGTDLPYFTVDGPDYVPDIHYGRLSVDSISDVLTMKNKIIDYEKSPPTDPNFYRTITSLAGNDFSHFDTMNYINEYLTSLDIAKNTFTETAVDEVKTKIAAGNTLVYYYGHGNAQNYYSFYGTSPEFDGWWDPAFYTEDFVDVMVGYHEWPLVLSLACNTGWFDGETDNESTTQPYSGFYEEGFNPNVDAFCEEITRLGNNKGAIAAIGATRLSELRSNKFFLTGMIDALWDGFDEEYSAGERLTLGQMMWFGKMMCFNAFTQEAILSQLTFEMYHLFGDPELAIYTQKPQELVVSYNDQIGFGGPQSFWVTVTSQDTQQRVQSAKVCVHGTTVHDVFYTNREGVAECTIVPLQSEALTITVTHKDFIPFQDEIVVCSQKAWITATPEDGVTGTDIVIHGENFNPQEEVKIDFGVFRELYIFDIQTSSFDEVISVPFGSAPQETIVAHQSDRCASVAFGRWDNRPDLVIYSQWDESTWYLNPAGSGSDANPRWNNPCIRVKSILSQIPVGTFELIPPSLYMIEADVRNISPEDAHGTTVLFEWSGWGIGQKEWTKIAESGPFNVPGNGITTFLAPFHITEEMDVCIRVTINHPEDANPYNNIGVENYEILYIGTLFHNTGEVDIPLFREIPRLSLNWSTEKDIDTEWIAVITRPPDSEGPSVFGDHPALEFITPGAITASNFQRTYVITGYEEGIIISGVEITIFRSSEIPIDPVYYIWNLIVLNLPSIFLLLIVIVILIVISVRLIRRRREKQRNQRNVDR